MVKLSFMTSVMAARLCWTQQWWRGEIERRVERKWI